MFTASDLKKIRTIIREEVELGSESLNRDLQGEIKLSRIEIQNEIRLLKNQIKNLELRIKKIEKNTSTITSFFDKEYLDLRKQVKRIEEHLNLSSLS
jgi:hypothetical protein